MWGKKKHFYEILCCVQNIRKVQKPSNAKSNTLLSELRRHFQIRLVCNDKLSVWLITASLLAPATVGSWVWNQARSRDVCLQRSFETQKWVSIGPQAPLKENEKGKKEEEEAEAKKKKE